MAEARFGIILQIQIQTLDSLDLDLDDLDLEDKIKKPSSNIR